VLPTCEAAVLAMFHLIMHWACRVAPIGAQPIRTQWNRMIQRDSPKRWNHAFAEVVTLGRFKAPDALIASLFEPE
jgi:hypothetical protein